MKITFLGTRGYIESRNDSHHHHAATMISYYGRDVMIDCGEDWEEDVFDVSPDAIIITHAHPDHAFGLKNGAPCPVWATDEAREKLSEYPIQVTHTVAPREPTDIEGITFEAFPVAHSTIAPAVGYRITAGRVTIFYVPDVVYIHEREKALTGCRRYIGDAATLSTSMVRKPDDTLIGHTPMRTQLTWCQKFDIPEAVFTHCGSHIVDGDEAEVNKELQEMADERGVKATIAHDGDELILR